MSSDFSRRHLFDFAGAAAIGLAGRRLTAQQQPPPAAPVIPEPPEPVLQLPPSPIIPINRRSNVFLLKGEDRRKMIHDALMGIDAELRPALARKKSVLIKPNLTSTGRQFPSTHADTLRGVLDYLGPRFKGPIVIAEASSGDTMKGYDNFKYTDLVKEYASQKVSLVDLNEEGLYVPVGVVSYDVHPLMMRIAKRLMDPDTFIINPCILKTHDTVVMTGAVKNMVLGGALRSGRKETTTWSDKLKFHMGPQQIHYNMTLVAQRMSPFWGATVVDGYEGMEGDGPLNGTVVPHRVAYASTDYVAADRIGTELMGINPKWVGYLQYCEMFGIGNYDISKIDVRGEKIAELKKTYRLHTRINRQLAWMGLLKDDPVRDVMNKGRIPR